MKRSPAEVLGAIIDEVEGLRRTDARSHLPERLLSEARMALEVGTVGVGSGQLNSIDGLIGRTVSHVFEGDLKRAQMVIVCTDGSFIALDSERDCDYAYIQVHSRGVYAPTVSGLDSYLRPPALVDVGLMSKADQQKAEQEERAEKLRDSLKRHEEQAEFAKRELAKLEGATQ